MPTPYHVRLALSQYGEQFRAELFTVDLGDTEGDLLAELPPSLAEWVPYLAQGADLPPDAAAEGRRDTVLKEPFQQIITPIENGRSNPSSSRLRFLTGDLARAPRLGVRVEAPQHRFARRLRRRAHVLVGGRHPAGAQQS